MHKEILNQNQIDLLNLVVQFKRELYLSPVENITKQEIENYFIVELKK